MPDQPGGAAVIDHPYRAEIDLERDSWTEISALVRPLSPEERLRPGYFHDPDWSVKDLIAHLGSWMADAEQHLLRIEAGTEVDEPIDIDAVNARYLAALHDHDWPTIWTLAVSARVQMLSVWARLHVRTEAADYWVRKAGAEHDGEHLPMLRAWVAEIRGTADLP